MDGNFRSRGGNPAVAPSEFDCHTSDLAHKLLGVWVRHYLSKLYEVKGLGVAIYRNRNRNVILFYNSLQPNSQEIYPIHLSLHKTFK